MLAAIEDARVPSNTDIVCVTFGRERGTFQSRREVHEDNLLRALVNDVRVGLRVFPLGIRSPVERAAER